MQSRQNLVLNVNGVAREVEVSQDESLLRALREHLTLTGTKYGCGEGQCGACTVLIDGRATRACLTKVGQTVGRAVQTIEHLAGPVLHPVQQAFLDHDAMQCGYCTPGMIMSTLGLLRRQPTPSRAEIASALQGNICRCCIYPRILDAVEHAARLMKHGRVKSEAVGE